LSIRCYNEILDVSSILFLQGSHVPGSRFQDLFQGVD
jgi:hypothetical protein